MAKKLLCTTCANSCKQDAKIVADVVKCPNYRKKDNQQRRTNGTEGNTEA